MTDSSKRTPVKPLTLAGSTGVSRPDVRADVRPDARTYTQPPAFVQAQVTRGAARRRERAQRELDATARAYKALVARTSGKREELGDATEEALAAGMTLEEVQAVVVLAGLPADLIDPELPYGPEGTHT